MKKFISEIEKQIYASLGVSKQLLDNTHISTYGESLLKDIYKTDKLHKRTTELLGK